MTKKHVDAEHSDELPALMEINIHGALWAARRLQDGFLTYVLGVAAEHLAELQPQNAHRIIGCTTERLSEQGEEIHRHRA